MIDDVWQPCGMGKTVWIYGHCQRQLHRSQKPRRASDWQLIILIQFLIKKGIIDANEIHDYIRSSTDEIEQLIAQSFDDEDLKRLHVNNFKNAMSVMMKDMNKE